MAIPLDETANLYFCQQSWRFYVCVYITDSYIGNGPAAGLFPQSDEEIASFTVKAQSSKSLGLVWSSAH